MLFDQIDARLFKAFLHAASEKSFTIGAIKAGMTQSGMSQQIARLEEQLGINVFERVNKKILLTDAGEQLRKFIENYNDTLDNLMEEVTQSKQTLRGSVRYAMPGSCLKTPHFPKLLEMTKEQKDLRLDVRLAANEQIFDWLMEGSIDFGFVTKKSLNPAINFDLFAEEEYVLVSKDKKDLELNAENISRAKFINYPGFGTLFDIWKRHFFPRKEFLNEFTISSAGTISNFDGAMIMATHGVGATIVPRHCVHDLLEKKELHEFKSKDKANPKGKIYLITRNQYDRPRRVQMIIDCFWKMKS